MARSWSGSPCATWISSKKRERGKRTQLENNNKRGSGSDASVYEGDETLPYVYCSVHFDRISVNSQPVPTRMRKAYTSMRFNGTHSHSSPLDRMLLSYLDRLMHGSPIVPGVFMGLRSRHMNSRLRPMYSEYERN